MGWVRTRLPDLQQTPGEIKRLPFLENLLAWDKAYPQQWWEYEESTKAVSEWLRRRGPGNSA